MLELSSSRITEVSVYLLWPRSGELRTSKSSVLSSPSDKFKFTIGFKLKFFGFDEAVFLREPGLSNLS